MTSTNKELDAIIDKLVAWYEGGGETLDPDEALAALQALIKIERLEAEIELLKKHRRWFERMAEYADVKADAMSEYDDEIAFLVAALEAANPPIERKKV